MSPEEEDAYVEQCRRLLDAKEARDAYQQRQREQLGAAAEEPAIMDPVTDYTALVAAAAQAAGPASGNGDVWLARVRDLAVDLAFVARQVEQDMQALDASHPFPALLEKVEIEDVSRRGVLTLIPSSGDPETIRTEQESTLAGRRMIERARELTGRWVLVYRRNEQMAGSKTQTVRMVVRLMDLGEGTVPNRVARQLLIGDANGNEQRARDAWTAAGLPLQGAVDIAALEQVRSRIRV
ncbi:MULTISPECIES: hypothetical protein [unclassified Streptomyces]|uniref:hypothetical protein n=1 Tax=unclassified Streptomyces TaxID=2593676 RepID=UPI003319020B